MTRRRMVLFGLVATAFATALAGGFLAGLTFTHVGSRGIDIPQLSEALLTERTKGRVDPSRLSGEDAWGMLDELKRRIALLETRDGQHESEEKEQARDAAGG